MSDTERSLKDARPEFRTFEKPIYLPTDGGAFNGAAPSSFIFLGNFYYTYSPEGHPNSKFSCSMYAEPAEGGKHKIRGVGSIEHMFKITTRSLSVAYPPPELSSWAGKMGAYHAAIYAAHKRRIKLKMNLGEADFARRVIEKSGVILIEDAAEWWRYANMEETCRSL